MGLFLMFYRSIASGFIIIIYKYTSLGEYKQSKLTSKNDLEMNTLIDYQANLRELPCLSILHLLLLTINSDLFSVKFRGSENF
jgi:hypothetical protein